MMNLKKKQQRLYILDGSDSPLSVVVFFFLFFPTTIFSMVRYVRGVPCNQTDPDADYILELVSSPDLIRHVYRFQYNARDTESDLRWGWFWVWDRDYTGVCMLT